MGPDIQAVPVSREALWAGRILSALPVLMLVFSAVMKVVKPTPAQVVNGFEHLGYPQSRALGLAILELVCTALFVIPRTSVVGAILLTAYLGGATATHVRVGDPFFIPIILGVLVWVGLLLRDNRLRALLPFRSDPSSPPGRMGVFKKILVGLATIVVVFVLVVGLLPAEYRIARSAAISAPPAEVFAQVNDFHNWEPWSPWAKLDPASKVTFEGPRSGKDAVFTWAGNDQVGEGRMTIIESRPNELIRIKLDFKKPFESTSTAEFTFKPEGKQTVVTWSMYGENNFVGRAFCLFMNMDKMLGGYFDNGLAQMKAVAEAAAPK